MTSSISLRNLIFWTSKAHLAFELQKRQEKTVNHFLVKSVVGVKQWVTVFVQTAQSG